jgi:hypothetical protein
MLFSDSEGTLIPDGSSGISSLLGAGSDALLQAAKKTITSRENRTDKTYLNINPPVNMIL